MNAVENALMRFLEKNELEMHINERGDIILRSTHVLDTDEVNLNRWLREE